MNFWIGLLYLIIVEIEIYFWKIKVEVAQKIPNRLSESTEMVVNQ